MIAIGRRPIKEELFNEQPKERIAILAEKPSQSPEMVLNGIDKKTGKGIINRIPLSRKAIVKVLRVESPSKIWVQLQNHITDNTLTFQEPFDLKPESSPTIGKYALAPIEERTYRRCRIEEKGTVDGVDLYRVFFIDDANTVWLKPECLAVLDESYMFYPWQAIQVSMLGVYPGVDGLDDSSKKWSTETCANLRKVLNDFSYISVDVILSSVNYNDYARPIVCDLFGIKNSANDVRSESSSRSEVSIASLLATLPSSSLIHTIEYDAAYHEFYESGEIVEPVEMPDFLKQFPENWKLVHEKDEKLFQEISPDSADWEPELCQVEMFTEKDLEPFTRASGDVMLTVEGQWTKSAFEWYARPIKEVWLNDKGAKVTDDKPDEVTGERPKPTDEVIWMINGNDELLAFAEIMDNYYSNVKNRKPLEAKTIENLHKKGVAVYAVCAVNEDKAAYTGEWQRVQIISCETFAEVRFLDSGGRDMVLTSSLYRIHKQHCRYPPKCLQLSMHGLRSSTTSGKWNQNENSVFKSYLREDVPILVKREDMKLLNSIDAKITSKPYEAHHVFFVRDLITCGEDVSIKQELQKSKFGTFIVSENSPKEWK